jgi:hypothetical protein
VTCQQERIMVQHPCNLGSRATFGTPSLPNRTLPTRHRNRLCLLAVQAAAFAVLALPPATASAQDKYVVEPVAELRTTHLPAGSLYWRIENFPTLEQAKAAAVPSRWNPDTVSYDGSPSLAAEIGGKAWLFTLDAKDGKTAGGTLVAEVGPLPAINAPQYLLRINRGTGPSGSTTPVHMHPGSESFYILAGRLGQKTPNGVRYVEAGGTMNGNAADTPMQVFNAGTTDVTAIIMFVVDATRPFSVPTRMTGSGAAVSGQSSPPASPRERSVEALVNKAAALIDASGKAAFSEFRTNGTEWFHGDTYLFAYDLKGNVLLNPAFPAREGTNVSGQKDSNGKLFHDAMIRTAESNGSGWVDYMFPKPGQAQPSQKWAYVKAVKIDGVPGLVASGFYPG